MDQLEKKIAEVNEITLENRRLHAQILKMKETYQTETGRLREELNRVGRRAQQRAKLNEILDRYTHIKQNQQRSRLSQFPAGAILGRPTRLRDFLETNDEKAAVAASSDHYPEFGFPSAPLFSEAAEEELAELEVVREAWEALQFRHTALVTAKKRAAEFKEKKAHGAAPEIVG